MGAEESEGSGAGEEGETTADSRRAGRGAEVTPGRLGAAEPRLDHRQGV